MIPIISATIATAALLALSVLQTLVALGQPYGAFVYGGRHRVLPPGLRIMSAITVALYVAFAAILSPGPGSSQGRRIRSSEQRPGCCLLSHRSRSR